MASDTRGIAPCRSRLGYFYVAQPVGGRIRKCLVLASWIWCVSGQSAAPASVWDGIYTDQQAERGAAGYREACASCHGEKLKGHGQNPPLAGDSFTSNWNGSNVGDQLEKIQVSMPADRPGKLSKAQNAAILAYILQFNKFPGGDKELPADADALKGVRFEADKPVR
jgi:mono/diheme cytochrome c family protein